jgi:hypothetical protein
MDASEIIFSADREEGGDMRWKTTVRARLLKPSGTQEYHSLGSHVERDKRLCLSKPIEKMGGVIGLLRKTEFFLFSKNNHNLYVINIVCIVLSAQ